MHATQRLSMCAHMSDRVGGGGVSAGPVWPGLANRRHNPHAAFVQLAREECSRDPPPRRTAAAGGRVHSAAPTFVRDPHPAPSASLCTQPFLHRPHQVAAWFRHIFDHGGCCNRGGEGEGEGEGGGLRRCSGAAPTCASPDNLDADLHPGRHPCSCTPPPTGRSQCERWHACRCAAAR